MKVFAVLLFLNSLSADQTDSSFYVFEGPDLETVMEDCLVTRQVILDYTKRFEGEWLRPNTGKKYTPDNLICLSSGEFR